MKQKTESVLSAYTAVCETLSSIPVSEADEYTPLTDEQIEAILNRETETVSPQYQAACDLLEAIKAEEPHFQQVTEENRRDEWEENEVATDKGLTTEINRSTTLVNLRDTLEGCSAVLKRHPYGYKNGSRDSKGRVSDSPFTDEETEAAEKWLAGVNPRG